MSYILKFEYSNKEITENLIPWNIGTIDNTEADHIQIGLAIKYPNNIIKIVTPFFIQLPYARCTILNTDIILQLISYCIYTRVAVYNVKNIDNFYKFELLNTDISNLSLKSHIEQIDKTKIEIQDISINIENKMNENIYPFVWLKCTINESNKEDLIAGLPVYHNNILIGIIYNIDSTTITIIPNINIILNLANKPLSNIFFNYTSKRNNVHVNDIIININKNKIINDLIYYNKLNIFIPINTFLWYESIMYNTFKFNIIRNGKKININIKTEQLKNKLFFDINTTTECYSIDNFIIIKPNLLMVEWLIENNIILKNYLYLCYMINPFKKIKNNYLLAGTHKYIKELDEYYSELVNINTHLQLFNIVNINQKKLYNINKIKFIKSIKLTDAFNKLIII